MKKVREFGVAFESQSAKDYIAAARLAEQLGFGTFWVPEDPVFPGAFATAAAVAANTTKIKVGIGVLNPWTRHPVQTAMELAALDDVSEGRAVLGLGAGVKLWIEDQLGISYTRPAIALRETIEIVNGLLRGDQPTYGQGMALTLRDVRVLRDALPADESGTRPLTHSRPSTIGLDRIAPHESVVRWRNRDHFITV